MREMETLALVETFMVWKIFGRTFLDMTGMTIFETEIPSLN